MTDTAKEGKARHTPEPWTVEDDGSVQAHGVVICNPAYAEDFPCVEDEDRAKLDDECAANARLIAAAPILLANAKKLNEAIEDWREHGAPNLALLLDAWEAQQTAIARAEGGE